MFTHGVGGNGVGIEPEHSMTERSTNRRLRPATVSVGNPGSTEEESVLAHSGGVHLQGNTLVVTPFAGPPQLELAPDHTTNQA